MFRTFESCTIRFCWLGVMLMRYGLPYQGSKSRIADWVVGNLPSAPVLVDIMCGGGAVSHAAVGW